MLRIGLGKVHQHVSRNLSRSNVWLEELSRKEKRRQEAKQHEMKKHQNADQAKTKGYQPVIGLEVHAQILSNSKLFSGASTEFNLTKSNQHVSLMDAAIPGTLPVINKVCIEQAIKTGFALSGNVQKISQFDRKHYFYPDLPHAYQITQQFKPIVRDGQLSILLGEQEKIIRIQRLQIEMDSGKSLHDQDPEYSLIDLNRAGIALMEIVSHPDIHSSQEAELYLKKLQFLVRHVGTCDGNMEEGSMRCDVNVSVHKPGEPFGTRCEIKNVGSIASVAKAIDFEIKRQIEIIESGKQVSQETRLFDAKTNRTVLLRSKENTPDYRFFPDPDLPPLTLSNEFISNIRESLLELPDKIIARLQNEYKLSLSDANTLLHAGALQFFEQAMRVPGQRDAKQVTNWVLSELLGQLNLLHITIEESPITPVQIASLVDAIASEAITGKIGKQVIGLMMVDKRQTMEIVKENGWQQINDEKVLADMIEKLLSQSQELISQVEGNKRVFGHFVGKIMEETNGMANPTLVNRILKERIEKLK